MAQLDQIARPPVGTAQLSCLIRDTAGNPLEGNIFLELHHLDSNSKWHAFRYESRTQSHIIRNLPRGRFLLHVTAAGFAPFETETLLGDDDGHVEVRLKLRANDLLVLDARNQKRSFSALAERLEYDAQARTEVIDGSNGRFSLAMRLTVALLADARVRAALGGVACRQSMGQLAGWVREQVRESWVFRVNGALQDQAIESVVENRLQVFALTKAIFANPPVARMLPALSPEDVHQQLLRFLSSLDSPELDGLQLLLVEICEPRRAVVERFLRNIQWSFELRPERGTAVPVAVSDLMPTAPKPTIPYIDPLSDQASTHREVTALKVFPVADALADAISATSGPMI